MLIVSRLISVSAVIAPLPVYVTLHNLLQVEPETSALIGLAAQIPLVFLFMWFYNKLDDKQRSERQETQKVWTDTIDAMTVRHGAANAEIINRNREWVAEAIRHADERHADGMARLGDLVAANTQTLMTVGETLRQVSQMIVEHDVWERQAQSKVDVVVQLLDEERSKKRGSPKG